MADKIDYPPSADSSAEGMRAGTKGDVKKPDPVPNPLGIGTIDTTGQTGTAAVDLFLAPFGLSAGDAPKVLARAAWILLGVMLILIGVAMVMSGSKTAALTKSLAMDAAELIPGGGKAVKIAKKVL